MCWHICFITFEIAHSLCNSIFQNQVYTITNYFEVFFVALSAFHCVLSVSCKLVTQDFFPLTAACNT